MTTCRTALTQMESTRHSLPNFCQKNEPERWNGFVSVCVCVCGVCVVCVWCVCVWCVCVWYVCVWCVCVCVCVHGSHMVYPVIGQVETISLLHYYLVPRHRREIRVGRHVHPKMRHSKCYHVAAILWERSRWE